MFPVFLSSEESSFHGMINICSAKISAFPRHPSKRSQWQVRVCHAARHLGNLWQGLFVQETSFILLPGMGYGWKVSSTKGHETAATWWALKRRNPTEPRLPIVPCSLCVSTRLPSLLPPIPYPYPPSPTPVSALKEIMVLRTPIRHEQQVDDVKAPGRQMAFWEKQRTENDQRQLWKLGVPNCKKQRKG